MTNKVCVDAWNGGPHKTKDAVTVKQLVSMIASLAVLGVGEDEPVTFLFDDDHVWLETVEFEDHGFAGLKIPRVVNELGEDEKGAEWVDRGGDKYRWDDDCWIWLDHTTGRGWLPAGFSDLAAYGPYVEVLV